MLVTRLRGVRELAFADGFLAHVFGFVRITCKQSKTLMSDQVQGFGSG